MLKDLYDLCFERDEDFSRSLRKRKTAADHDTAPSRKLSMK